MQGSRNKELVFVLGGARSGKSSWALRYTEEYYASHVFMATAQALDSEMEERIRRHKEARGPQWGLIEEPLEIAKALVENCMGFEAVLLDCLTVWLSNVLSEKGDERVDEYVPKLIEALKKTEHSIIVVSNEEGLGNIPDNPLGRKFRDLAGHLNQEIAKIADKVILMVAGLPMYLKGNPD